MKAPSEQCIFVQEPEVVQRGSRTATAARTCQERQSPRRTQSVHQAEQVQHTTTTGQILLLLLTPTPHWLLWRNRPSRTSGFLPCWQLRTLLSTPSVFTHHLPLPFKMRHQLLQSLLAHMLPTSRTSIRWALIVPAMSDSESIAVARVLLQDCQRRAVHLRTLAQKKISPSHPVTSTRA